MSYIIAGGLWILCSDELLPWMFKGATPQELTRLQTYKGWLFIVVTAGFLYVLVSRSVAALYRSEQALRWQAESLEQGIAERTARLQETNTELEAFVYPVGGR